MTIDDEVRDVLKDLVAEVRATSARIVVDDDNPRSGVPARTIALGGGEYLRIELPTRVTRTPARELEMERDDDEASHGPNMERDELASARGVDIEAAFERVIRQLRAIRRKYEAARLPEIVVAPGLQPTSDKVLERIESYMKALATLDRASNAFVTKGRLPLSRAPRVREPRTKTACPALIGESSSGMNSAGSLPSPSRKTRISVSSRTAAIPAWMARP